MKHANAGGRASALDVDVAVIGAGPAGLTAAYLLSREGRKVVLLEKDPDHVGGLSRTVSHDGASLDIGGHTFASGNPDIIALWDEILPGTLAPLAWSSRVCLGGKFYDLPLKPVQAALQFGIMRSISGLFSMARARLFSATASSAADAESWGIARYGREFHASAFKPYAEKLWGMPVAETSADWAQQQFADKSGNSECNHSTSLRHLPRGPGMMWDAARDGIIAQGGIILMGRALTQIAADGNGGWRVAAGSGTDQCVVTARHVISSAPLREVVARIHPLPDATWNASKLKYRDYLVVALSTSVPPKFSDHVIHIADDSVEAGRIRNLGSWSPDMVAQGAAGGVAVEYFCTESDACWAKQDEDLIAQACREVTGLGLVDPASVSGGFVVRQEKAFPVYDDGYHANLVSIRQELSTQYPNLHLVGRNGAHHLVTQDEAMASAMQAAEIILAQPKAALARPAIHTDVDKALPAKGSEAA